MRSKQHHLHPAPNIRNIADAKSNRRAIWLSNPHFYRFKGYLVRVDGRGQGASVLVVLPVAGMHWTQLHKMMHVPPSLCGLNQMKGETTTYT